MYLCRRKVIKFGAVLPLLWGSSTYGRGDLEISNKGGASEKITLGIIGAGGMGMYNLGAFLNEPACRVIAICDVDKNHLTAGVAETNKFYGDNGCRGYSDFRELLDRDDIDAVCICTPDHWHSIIAIEAARRGKDIYGEKPLSHTLKEGRAICDAARQYGIVWQTGSWQRSQSSFRFACELILNGTIGKVHTVEVGLPAGPYFFDKENEQLRQPPAELDYNYWLGPAPYARYCPARVHSNWRWNLDYGGGQLMDWVGHHVDIAHWGLGMDYDGPVKVEGEGNFIVNPVWNSASEYRVVCEYANGLRMIIANEGESIRLGTKWTGEDGWVWVSRQGMESEPADLLKTKFGPNDIQLYRSPGHQRNFLDCVKSRKQTLTPCEVAHRSATPGHLGLIAMKLGRAIRFDPATESILNDHEASVMLGKTMREPWRY